MTCAALCLDHAQFASKSGASDVSRADHGAHGRADPLRPIRLEEFEVTEFPLEDINQAIAHAAPRIRAFQDDGGPTLIPTSLSTRCGGHSAPVPLADFIHLKVRSAYSLTEGANKVDKVVALAKENAMPAVAVTDRNNLFGALEFSQYAAKAGIQPIVGCDLAIRREEEGGIATAGKLPSRDWLTLLVQNEQGYLNLMRLVSRAISTSRPARSRRCRSTRWSAHRGPAGADRQRRRARSAGCWARGKGRPRPTSSSGWPSCSTAGSISSCSATARTTSGASKAHCSTSLAKGSLARHQRRPLPKESMYEAHDVLLCIEQGAHIEDPNRRRLTPEHYFKSAAEMRQVSPTCPRPATTPWWWRSAAPTCPSRASRSCRATPSSTAARGGGVARSARAASTS
jgi:hypothetical protein